MMQALEELDSLTEEVTDVKKMPIEGVLEELYALDEQRKQTAARMDVLKQVISAQVNEEPGDYSICHGQYTATIKRSEAYDWDEDQLEVIVDGIDKKDLPAAFSVKVGVNKRKFDALDAATQATYLPALTVKPGRTLIKVTKEESDET
jgi:hypothetical protein